MGPYRTTWISETDGGTFNLVGMSLGLFTNCAQGVTVTAYRATDTVIVTLRINTVWTSSLQEYTPANRVNVQRLGV